MVQAFGHSQEPQEATNPERLASRSQVDEHRGRPGEQNDELSQAGTGFKHARVM